MATPDMEIIKEVPGYRVILKAVLKSQIQQLVEQLAIAANEESIILTASVADGTLSHLGSDSAKGFLEDHEDVKSQFLGYCLKMYQKQKEQERQEKEFVSSRKSGLVYPVSLIRSSPGLRHEPYSRPSKGRVTPTKITEVARSVKTEPTDEGGSEIPGSEVATFTNNSNQSSYLSYSVVANEDKRVNCSLSVKPENFLDESESRVTCGDKSDTCELSDNANVNVKQESLNVKQETTSDSEMDLEITGVEAGQPVQPQDWDAYVTMGMNYDPTGATGSQADMTEESSNKRHVCDHCQKTFKSQSKLARHVLIHLGEKPRDAPKEHSLYDIDAKSKQDTHLRQIRINTTQERHAFDHCQMAFKSKCDLSRHILTHTGERSFECSVCNKQFNRKGNLKEHMLVHTRERRFECGVCDKQFNHKGRLNEHMLIHTGEKPFECSVCLKRFTQKGQLNDHMVVHTGERPFECNVCHKQFNRKGILKRHMLVHKDSCRFSRVISTEEHPKDSKLS